MWRLWSRPLEWLGRLRLGFSLPRSLRVGDPGTQDAAGGFGWRDYVDAEKLFDLWGPVVDSPWVPYHTVPLFASLDRIKRDDIGPGEPVPPGGVTPPHPYPHAQPGEPAPPWVRRDTLTIVDLPGPHAVETGAWLVTAGCQPVCTFDNWPHPRGLIKAERVLAELLRHATTVAAARVHLTTDAPPVWICDNARLGQRAGSPGQFDNRYYLDDSILPGRSVLERAGITRFVYVTAGKADVPTLDLEEYFADVQKAGIQLWHVDLTQGLEPAVLALRQTPRPAPRTGFRRSSAGGFGTTVPQPSSGSSG